MTKPTFYDVLGVARDADAGAIKAAYRKLSRQFHPDRKGGDAERQAAVNDAYAVLSDAERRQRYDETGSDVRIDSLHVEARGELVDLFAQLLMKGVRDQVPRVAADVARQTIANLQSELEKSMAAEKLYRERIDDVKFAGEGLNLWQQLIEKSIENVTEQRQRFEHGVNVWKIVLEQLKLYRAGYVAPASSHWLAMGGSIMPPREIWRGE